MVTYIKSDLEFILKQIEIAEAHAAGQPLFGPNGLVPTYNTAAGLRTVDGSYNHLLPGQELWGASDQPFVEHLGTNYRPAEGGPLDPDGPGPAPSFPTASNYSPSNSANNVVIDSSLRTISNLIVDQTLANPAVIMVALARAGTPGNHLAITGQIQALFAPIEGLFLALDAATVTSTAAAAASAANPGDAALAAAATTALAAVVTAQATLDAASGALDTALEANGIVLDGNNVSIPAVAPDEGLSAPFNSWFTLFGQFFDHGLDLVNKGGSGTVFIPLQPDDPLYDPASPTNFMVLTRATTTAGADNVMGTADDVRPINHTTAYVDQNQTYTSHASHQVFVRQYALNAEGRPVATGNLIEGASGGMATWGEVKAQALMLGVLLEDRDVGNVPLLRTDQYGNFIPNAAGYAQVITGIGLDGIPNTADDAVVSGTPTAPVNLTTAGAIRTGHAFLADIAHNAVPTGLADGDIEVGLGNTDGTPTVGQYDNELLDAHYIAGDGRVNENIGLTAVHHVFHSEHNRLVEHTKEVVLADAQTLLDEGASQAEATAFLNEWLAVDVAEVPDGATGLVWDGERLFQAAKFGTEMQYQHLVFEEFARKIQPNINVFLVPDGFDTTIDPSIVAEFAHVVYRFGHSMLTESIDRFDPNFNSDHIGLIEGFLNPIQFNQNGGSTPVDHEISAGAIIRGMTRQTGNHIDEFVTTALRNNLLGLPLDLATINLARGRDTGVPSLNEARRQFYEATNQEALLKPYESWVDFAGHLKNEASIINFVAAYGTHSLITDEATVEGKRDAAMTLIFGVATGKFAADPNFVMPTDAEAFLNGTGAYAAALGGLENVDLWIGGLAEETMPFGGMLGSTFNFVFEVQMESLQNGDRFYYLQRLDGLHLFGEMEGNSFAGMIMRNTDATHLPSDVFSTPGLILEVDRTKQYNSGLGETAGLDGILEDDPTTAVNESADNLGIDPTGNSILTPLVIRNNPATVGPDTNYLRYTGGDHVVLGGTDNADILIGGIGDDTLFGDGGNDNLQGGFGNDIINGGDGDDIIRDSGGDDNIKGGAGNDVIHAGQGLDLVLAGDGNDFVILGTDMGSEIFGGRGDDFMLGNKNAERILGNEGNDWIETGTFDGAPGDNFDEILAADEIDGHDVFLGDGGFDEFIGEGGDDIMVGSLGRGKMAGMSGFDWATYKDMTAGVDADLSIPIVFDEAPVLPPNAALDEFESMEGLSGTAFNDVLSGTNDVAADRASLANGGTSGFRGSILDQQGIEIIAGLQEVVGAGVTSFDAGDIILGGDGSDTIRGNAGDDILDGDKWLDVQIGVFNGPNGTGGLIKAVDSMTDLTTDMFNGVYNAGQLQIIRSIKTADGAGDIDRAVFSGARAEYDVDFNTDGTITVAHVGGLLTDGTDTLRNIEVLDFTDQDISLVAPTLDLNGDSTISTTTNAAQAYRDTFETAAHNNSNGTVNWAATPWIESADITTGNVVTGGQIQLDNGTNELRFTVGDGAAITRTVNLSGLTTATLSFDYDRLNGFENLDAGETVQVQYSATGLFTPGNFTVLQTISGASGNGFTGAGSSSLALNLTGAGANAAIRFVSSAINGVNERVTIDNFNIATSVTTTTTVPGTPGNNYQTTYTENGAGVPIAMGPVLTDDGTTLASARVVLTNASAGDVLSAAGLPAGITAAVDILVAGQVTLTLSGTSSIANYRTALQQVRYSSTSDSPNSDPRILHVTVNDGLLNSNVATATVIVVSANDAPVGNVDTVITNAAIGTSFSIARSALLANDTDPEGSPVTITAVNTPIGLSAPNLGAAAVTVSDTGADGGSFNYVASDGTLTDPTTVVNVIRVNGTITGGAGNEIIVGNGAGTVINGGGGNDDIDAGDGNDTISGGTGNDIIQAGTGNDTITWNANAVGGTTDGFDMIDGGAGAADTFQLNGNASAEAFRIYTRAAAIAANIPVSGTLSEIVITRTVGLNTTVIAELDNIEEIRINTLQVTSPGGTAGTPGVGDTIQVVGDFTGTSLNFNTITIDGNAGDDTVDISGLTSAHRIVFRSNGGNDTIVGTLRTQDVIELPEGTVAGDFDESTDDNGVTTLSDGTHTISFVADGTPQLVEHGYQDDDHDGHDDEEDEDDEDGHGDHDGDDDDHDDDEEEDEDHGPDHDDEEDCDSDDDHDEDDDGAPSVPAHAGRLVGTAGDDVLVGTSAGDLVFGFAGTDYLVAGGGADVVRAGAGNDFIDAQAGNDIIFGEDGDDDAFGGSGDDMIYGDAGSDRLFGQAGNDLLTGGAGGDSVFGGAGNDLFAGSLNDGDDLYYGGDISGDDGIDTLDLGFLTEDAQVDLGTGVGGRGSAVSSQSGTDTLWGVENLVTGSGNDTITASTAVNVMDGGDGDDVFVFGSSAAANGDTIRGFEAGDRIDLSGIDANIGVVGNQAFTLQSGQAATAAGQIVVTHETREDGEYTIVSGNTGHDNAPEFRILLEGNHTLTNADFTH